MTPIQNDPGALLGRLTESLGFGAGCTRRVFMKAGIGSALACSALGRLGALVAGATPLIIVEQAEGVLVADPTRCVGCKRCELACTEYAFGRAQPSLARIKVSRNYNFGPRGQQDGFARSMGEFGDFRIVQDTCKQCPHPVPCATACPNGAIVAEPKLKARVVDRGACVGCRLCQRSCPWDLMSFDEEADKASKCDLCGGSPECVRACPAMALQFVSWRDLSMAVPVRRAAPQPDPRSAGCLECHGARRR
ncbi:MAG: 4Fe-4S dicluster domain-containing protein [Vicinamibacterales bacterium]